MVTVSKNALLCLYLVLRDSTNISGRIENVNVPIIIIIMNLHAEAHAAEVCKYNIIGNKAELCMMYIHHEAKLRCVNSTS